MPVKKKLVSSAELTSQSAKSTTVPKSKETKLKKNRKVPEEDSEEDPAPKKRLQNGGTKRAGTGGKISKGKAPAEDRPEPEDAEIGDAKDDFKSPMQKNNGDHDLLKLLWPYLATGFAPLGTKRESQCGLNALAESFFHACTHLSGDPEVLNEASLKVSFNAWGDYKAETPEGDVGKYRPFVDQFLRDHVDPKERNNKKKELTKLTWHSEEQLNLILKVANQEQGTDFQLGIIEQGGAKSGGKAQAKGAGTQTKAYIVGEAKWNCPVLWIFKNYGDKKAKNTVH